jgi:uncharacterized repeat protein (TIGR03803 family)
MKGDASKGSGKSNRARKTKARFHVIPFVNPSGETSFRVAGYKPSGERVRENFTTEEEAIGRKAELDIEAANIITTTATRLKATCLSDEQVQDAERAFAKLGGAEDAAREPRAGVTLSPDGRLWGVTDAGGAGGNGALFRMALDGSNYEVMYSFAATGIEGAQHRCALSVGPNNALYGMAAGGGTKNRGVLYRVSTEGISPRKDFVL